MRDLPPGLATDLAVLRLSGSEIEDRGDHVVARTPANPDYYWGNCVFVLDPSAVDDASRWLTVFEAAHPAAGWRAIGLPRPPLDDAAWRELGLEIEPDSVLSTRRLPKATPVPDGYTVRQIGPGDWESVVANELADNAETGEYDPVAHERFVRRRVQLRRRLSETGDAAFFGAFDGDVLASNLGIVRCGTTARYQTVGTHSAHRRRGLAGHLLGVAARWAGDRGCDRWVIITEATNPAGRVYRSVGFEPDSSGAQAFRAPAR